MFASFHPVLALLSAAAAFVAVMLTNIKSKHTLAYLAFVGVFLLVALTPGSEPLGNGLSPSNYVLPGIAAYGVWAIPSYALSNKYGDHQWRIVSVGVIGILASVFLIVYTYSHFSDFIGAN